MKEKSTNNGFLSLSRRSILLWITSIYAAIGGVFVATPFIKSFQPSRRAKAIGAPVDVDVSALAPGELKIVKWRGQPVWVLHRSEQMVQSLALVTDLLADPDSLQSKQPDYAQNTTRSVESEWLVTVGICTHLGCSPVFRPDKAAEDLGSDWQGGFFCPCHGSKFDFSGRVYKNVPAPTNLVIPPYHFVDKSTIRVGENPKV